MRDKFFVEPLLYEIKHTLDDGLVPAIGGPLDYTRLQDRGPTLRVPLPQEPFVTPGPCCTDSDTPGPRIGRYRKVAVYIYEGEEQP